MTDLAQLPETGTGSVGLDLTRRLVAEGSARVSSSSP